MKTENWDLPVIQKMLAHTEFRTVERYGQTWDCYLWTGQQTNVWPVKGDRTRRNPSWPYGRVCYLSGKHLVHRVSYELLVAPIPAGYEVDHLCGSTLCWHPEHVEAVTPAENRRRAVQRRHNSN